MAVLDAGYLRVGRIGRAPLRIHWTTPIGLFLFSGLSFNPLVWAALLAIMIVHEVGHALLARRYSLRLDSIDITAVGGVCRIEGNPSRREAAIVAWGGVLAQAALLVITLVVRGLMHFVAMGLLDGVFDTLITTNLILIALNLLPIAPLDGALAWRVFEGRSR